MVCDKVQLREGEAQAVVQGVGEVRGTVVEMTNLLRGRMGKKVNRQW